MFLSDSKLAHSARAAPTRDFVIFLGGNSCIARAPRAHVGLTVYSPWIQIPDVAIAISIARRDHRKSKFGLRQAIELIELYVVTKSKL